MSRPLDDTTIVAAENTFQQYLRGRGLKFTPERRTLLHEVLNSREHFEAEQLLINLRQEGKRVAKATIYRTLPLLVDCGILREVQFGDNIARYEPAVGQAPHDHMVCLGCHRVIEFDSEQVGKLRDEVAAQHGFAARSHRFQITGLCADCRSSGEANESGG